MKEFDMVSGDLLLMMGGIAVLPYVGEAVVSWVRTRKSKRR